MSTTTSHTPESEGPSRPARLIQNEATTEIPVHLLFRDDPDPVSVPLRPAVVARRQGTGEQPRLRRTGEVTPRPAPRRRPRVGRAPRASTAGRGGRPRRRLRTGRMRGHLVVGGAAAAARPEGAAAPGVRGRGPRPGAVGGVRRSRCPRPVRLRRTGPRPYRRCLGARAVRPLPGDRPAHRPDVGQPAAAAPPGRRTAAALARRADAGRRRAAGSRCGSSSSWCGGYGTPRGPPWASTTTRRFCASASRPRSPGSRWRRRARAAARSTRRGRR